MNKPESGVVAVHSLAEVYSNLTGIQGKQRASPDQALVYINQIRERFEIVTLNANDYVETISDCVTRGTKGGAIYDALVARCALNSGVLALYTWNTKDFLRLGPEIARLVRTPELAHRQ